MSASTQSVGASVKPAASPRRPGRSELLRRLLKNRGATVGLGIISVYVALALLSHVIAPYSPTLGALELRLKGPSWGHWLGTDELGRDVLSRLLYGSAISLEIQVTAVVLTMLVGVPWGLLAGYYGGWFDEVSMRLIDVMLAFPGILLAIGVDAIIGGGLTNVIFAVAIVSVPEFVRLVRGVVLGIRKLEFVVAARGIGESAPAIMARYILPGTVAPIVVQASIRMATVLLFASSLSFLGLGVQPPTPDWGAMLSNARAYMFLAPHVTAAPGVAITIVVIGFNLLGDGLRDVLDPRMRGS
ncbi:MAG TPA: ABC transporter permease [bacterium]|nr:ABC transporter permease [bacterium]